MSVDFFCLWRIPLSDFHISQIASCVFCFADLRRLRLNIHFLFLEQCFDTYLIFWLIRSKFRHVRLLLDLFLEFLRLNLWCCSLYVTNIGRSCNIRLELVSIWGICRLDSLSGTLRHERNAALCLEVTTNCEILCRFIFLTKRGTHHSIGAIGAYSRRKLLLGGVHHFTCNFGSLKHLRRGKCSVKRPKVPKFELRIFAWQIT